MAKLAGGPEPGGTGWTGRAAILIESRGLLVMLQRGERVDPAATRGVIRLGLPGPAAGRS